MTRDDDLEYVVHVFPEAAATAGIADGDNTDGWKFAIDEARLMAGVTVEAFVPDKRTLEMRALLDYTALKLLAKQLVVRRDLSISGSGGIDQKASSQLAQVRSMLADAIRAIAVYGHQPDGSDWGAGAMPVAYGMGGYP
jgi:hypothetical protein